MKLFILISILACALAAPHFYKNVYKPEKCNPEKCQLPDCRCSGNDIPGGLPADDTPQIVYLTFDDAVLGGIGGNYELYKEAFFDRKNPDGCPVSTTYFVSHEYTDYSRVHDLHARGHEIALHSITHTPSMDYWKNLSVEELEKEFGGQREMMSHLANIPIDDLKGARIPLLQLSGNNSFEALYNAGFTYDCSWPTRFDFWPYTMDYASTQDCSLGPCPEISLPGFWVVPMIMIQDDLNVTCSMVDACTNIPDDVEGIYDFLVRNFEKNYNSNRAPFGAFMHAAWFGQRENAREAYLKFIDYLQGLDDVYIVSIQRALEWIRNPRRASEQPWPECQKVTKPDCGNDGQGTNCQLKKGEEERWMRTCSACPDVYPWLGNPLGIEG